MFDNGSSDVVDSPITAMLLLVEPATVSAFNVSFK